MARKHSSINNPKKEVRKLFEKTFDLKRLDYDARIRPLRGRAMVVGAVTAGALYLIAYGLAYTGFSNNILPLESLAKLVWIMMIPTTILGLLVWQLKKNRLEFPVRQDIRMYMETLEKGTGLLWRFKPAWEHMDGNTTTIKKAMDKSEARDVEKLDIEDYCAAVLKLHSLILSHDGKHFPTRIAENVLENFQNIPNAEIAA